MSHNDSDKDKKNPSHDIRTIRLFPKAIYRSTVIKQKSCDLLDNTTQLFIFVSLIISWLKKQ